MDWIEPKNNKRSTYLNDKYTGDYFNIDDYNTWKNDINYIYELAVILYPSFSIIDMGSDKKYEDFFYADEFNNITKNIKTINQKTINKPLTEIREFKTNEPFLNYKEVNAISNNLIAIHNVLSNQFENRRKFTWNFGNREVF